MKWDRLPSHWENSNHYEGILKRIVYAILSLILANSLSGTHFSRKNYEPLSLCWSWNLPIYHGLSCVAKTWIAPELWHRSLKTIDICMIKSWSSKIRIPLPWNALNLESKNLFPLFHFQRFYSWFFVEAPEKALSKRSSAYFVWLTSWSTCFSKAIQNRIASKKWSSARPVNKGLQSW